LENNIYNEEDLFVKVENEFSAIFNEIIDSKELSTYRALYLKNKLEFIVDEISEYIQEINKYNAKLRKLRKIINNAILIITLLSFMLIFLNPYIPAVVNLIGLLARIKIKKYYLNNIKGKPVETKGNDLLILLQNCVTFLERKSRNREERMTKEFLLTPSKTLDVMVANEILQEYLQLEDVSEFITTLNLMDESLKICLVEILQEDLSVTNDNLEELLNMARENISRENLTKELKLCRNLEKKSEN